MENKENHTLNFYTFLRYEEALTNFNKHYDLYKLVIVPNSTQPKGIPKSERTCRFCGIKNSKSSFKSDSHLIPEMLGNHYLFSDFECDNCNKIFSRYETDLSYALGIYRTLFGIKGKRGVPKFDSVSNTIRAQQEEFHGVKAMTIQDKNTEEIKSFQFDQEKGECSIRFKKHGYIPIHVYKLLFKIALSIINESDASVYKRAFKFILDGNNDNLLQGMCRIVYFELPFEVLFDRPICYMFKKRDPNTIIPTHYFALYFKHMIFQFPLHFHDDDIKVGLYKSGELELPFCPPILFKIPAQETCFSEIRDLSSNQKIEEEQSISFSFDPKLLSELGAINPDTGEVTSAIFKPEEIVKMIFYNGKEKPRFPTFDKNQIK